MNGSLFPLTVEDITVRKRGAALLEGISLTFKQKGVTIVMGPNGAGKTTLLKALHGIERISSGSLRWNCPEAEVRSRQSFVFQTPVMMRRSVTGNLAYPLLVQGMARREAHAVAEQRAESYGLPSNPDLAARNLSGGEKQKLALARALITGPELLFLDEPTTNLDGTSTREIESILKREQERGTRIIMATHSIGQARRLATDVVFLNHGRLCEHSTGNAFFKRPKSAAGRAYLAGDIVE